MRQQAIQPRVEVVSHVYADHGVTVEVENAGAGAAVKVHLRAWVMDLVGTTYTPHKVMYRGARKTIPATQSTMRVTLPAAANPADFLHWKEAFSLAGVSPPAMDPCLLLVVLDYQALDRTPYSECVAIPLVRQVALPSPTASLPEVSG